MLFGKIFLPFVVQLGEYASLAVNAWHPHRSG